MKKKKEIVQEYKAILHNPYASPACRPHNKNETYAQWKRRHENYMRYEENRAMEQLSLPFYEQTDGIQLKLFKDENI